jgi:protein gp37/ParB-like chromosome segregation protein Spo0J
MKINEAASIIPAMSESEFEALKADIADKGLIHPIVTYQTTILDGRNRERACRELNIEPKYIEYDGDDLIGYVISANVPRRHLSESQRSMIAAKTATLRREDTLKQNRSDAPIEATRQSEAASMLNVSRSNVQRARKVVDHGVPQLQQAVESNQIAVSEAAAIADLDQKVQHQVLAADSKKERKERLRKAQAKAKQEKPQPPPFVLTGKSGVQVEKYYTIETWKELSRDQRKGIIEAGFESKAKMNEQDTTSIEWARHSLNTITGCRHGCPYCYARDIAERFLEQHFEPSFYPVRLAAPANEKVPDESATDMSYKNVFANSMSDLFGKWVPEEWIAATIDMARRNEQWNFLVLTKFPQRAADFEFPSNWWMGTTVDAQARLENAEKAFTKIKCGTKWLSCEPLLEPIKFKHLELFQWIVIGGARGSNRTPEWTPPFDWLANVHEQARIAGCRIYHKTNCGLPDEMRVREFPWAEPKVKSLPKAFRYLKGLNE